MTKQQTKTRETNQTKYKKPRDKPGKGQRQARKGTKIDKPNKGYKQRQESFKIEQNEDKLRRQAKRETRTEPNNRNKQRQN
jgi:hypothetical protein